VKEISVIITVDVDDDVSIGAVNNVIMEKLTGRSGYQTDRVRNRVYLGTATVKNLNMVLGRAKR
jgi:hypothetical protein